MRWLVSLAIPALASLAAAAVPYAPGEVLFSLRPGAGKVARADLLDRLEGQYGAVEKLFAAARSDRAKRVGNTGLGHWHRIWLQGDRDPAEVAAELVQLPLIENAQANFMRREAALADSLFAVQWNLAAMGWSRQSANALEPIVVAIVDSGIDADHADIAGQLWTNAGEAVGEAGVDDDGNGYVDDLMGWDFSDGPGLPGIGDYLVRDADPTDESGHGTHVAGIVAAATDNGHGIAGVAPDVELMVLRAGFNLPGGGYLQDDDIAAALVYAADNGARVVNMSWGDPQPSPLVEAAVRYAAARGLVLVAAAGNEGANEVFYPARSNQTLAVGAAAPGGGLLGFSNFGASIDLAAPGHAIWSLAPGGGYVERSGTSMAAAHVSGLAALLLARRPAWTPAQVRGALLATALDLGPAGWDESAGAGLAHFAALEVENAPQVQIEKPGAGDAWAGDIPVVLALEEVERYELSWGLGALPRRWHEIAAGAVDGSERTVVWETADLVDGAYVLRLRGLGVRGWVEDRVQIQVQEDGPQAREVEVVHALDGPHWSRVVAWETAVPAGGRVELAGAVRYVLPAPPGRRSQRVVVPVDLNPGEYDIWVAATDAAGVGQRTLAGSVVLGGDRVDRWALERRLVLPDGYLLPELGDFNGDGRPELVQMGYGGGLQYNAGDYYQWNGGESERVFTSLQLYIPWKILDADGDGRREMMAVDAQRVRLFEAATEGSFPERLLWEQRDVWGGEAADLDGDGQTELFLRAGSSSFLQVFESAAADQLAEIAVLHNPGEGQNQLGQRQVIADFDGDGRGELVAGDGDGDLFSYEQVADDAYRSRWHAAGLGDARIVGGGADWDGDGRAEFAVARFFSDPFDLEARRWQIEVFSSAADNGFAAEWQVEILGGQPGGSGIGQGDLDGDGMVEWALVTVPDIYVFRSTGPDAYEPIWHSAARQTHRPLVGDWDADGNAELGFNGEGQVEVYALDRTALAVEWPAGLVARPRDDTAIELGWQAVAGATGYRVFRAGEVLVANLADLSYIDGELAPNTTYFYRVAAIGADGALGPLTPAVAATPTAAPQLLAVRRMSAAQLELEFSTAMAAPAPYRFRLEPDGGRVVAALADRGGRRIVLSFATALPDSGEFVLQMEGVRSQAGGPLAAPVFAFALGPLRAAVRPQRAEVLSARQVAVYFDGPIVADGELHEAFAFADTAVRIAGARVDGDRVVIDLAEPLRPLGRSYGLRIAGLRDHNGLAVAGAVAFRFAALDLRDAVPFPNPYRPSAGLLTFGLLTAEAEITIYDAAGSLVCRLAERDGDGGVEWDGRNQDGQLVGSGVYLYRIASSQEARLGKLAVLRD